MPVVAGLADKTSGNNSILISTGEASGDAVGAALLAELRRMGFSGQAFAIGAKKLGAAGANLICDSSNWGAIGVYQSLKVAPRIFVDMRKTKKWLQLNRPRLVVAIDFGYFNVRLSRFAKENGSLVLYFMPPGSWRKNGQGKDLAHIADVVATPFEWSAKILQSMGANAEWVGHPIVQLAAQYPESDREGLAVLPGSRAHEIRNNLPVIAKAVGRLGDLAKPVKVVLAPTANADEILRCWQAETSVPVQLSTDPAPATLKASKAAIVCSGTATLECAVCDCPMVVVYRLDRMMALEYRILKPKFDYVAMPSIILGKRVAQELLHHRANPEIIAMETEKLLIDSGERQQQLQDFAEIRSVLGPTDAITRTASLALDLLQNRK